MSFRTIIIVIVSKTNYNICQDKSKVIFERRENLWLHENTFFAIALIPQIVHYREFN